MGNEVGREGQGDRDVTSSEEEDEELQHVVGAVVHEGFLVKRARRSGRNWKRRWVQLIQIDSKRGALVYFKRRPTSFTECPSGRIIIDKTSRCITTRKFCKQKSRPKPFCFQLTRASCGFIFYAASERRSDLIGWTMKINSIIDKFSRTSLNRQKKIAETLQGELHDTVSSHILNSQNTSRKASISVEKKTSRNTGMKSQDAMRNTLLDLWKSEEDYHTALCVLEEIFIPVIKKFRIDVTNALMFSHVVQIKQLHAFLISELRGSMDNIMLEREGECAIPQVGTDSCVSIIVGRVADTISRFAPFFLIYVSAVNKFPASQVAIRRRESKDRDFKVAIEVAEMNPRCCGLDLHSYLIKLVQRIPNYNLFLNKLIKCTPTEATVTLQSLRLAQAKMREVAAKLDHNAQQGWKVRNNAQVIVRSHKLLAHGHPERERRASMALKSTKIVGDGVDGDASDSDVDLEQFDTDEETSDEDDLELLPGVQVKRVLPQFVNATIEFPPPPPTPQMRTGASRGGKFAATKSAHVADEGKDLVDDADFEWPGPPPTPKKKQSKDEDADKESTSTSFGMKKRRPRRSDVGGSNKSLLPLAVHLRTLPARRTGRPTSPGKMLLNLALSPNKRSTVDRHEAITSAASAVISKNSPAQLIEELFGLGVKADAKQRPLALSRRPVTGRARSKNSQLCVYMPKNFSMLRYHRWLCARGYDDDLRSPIPPASKDWKDPPFKAMCSKRVNSTNDDGEHVTVETWNDSNTGEKVHVYVGPGQRVALHLPSGEKLVMTQEATVEVMYNGYSRQTNRDGSEIYQTPWGVRKMYFANGTEVTLYPDGERTQLEPDGTEIRKLADGTILQSTSTGVTTIQRCDGTKIQRNADGSTLELNADGSTIQTEPDGTIIVRDIEGRRTQHHVDGTKITIFKDGRVVQESPDGEISKYALPPDDPMRTEDDILQDLSMYPVVIKATFRNRRLGIKFGLIRGHVAYVNGDAKAMGILPGDRFWRVNGLDVVDPHVFECAGPENLNLDLRFKWAVMNTTTRPIYIEFRRQKTVTLSTARMPSTNASSADVTMVEADQDDPDVAWNGRLAAPRASEYKPNWRHSYKPKKKKRGRGGKEAPGLKKSTAMLDDYRRRNNRVSLARKKVTSEHDLMRSSIPL